MGRHDAVEGCADAGVSQIDGRDADAGLFVQQLGLRRIAGRALHIQVGCRGIALLRQAELAIVLVGGLRHGRLGRLGLGLGLFQLGLIRSRLDDEQDVALLHQGAVFVIDLLQEAFDTRLEVDGVDRHRVAGQLQIGRDRLLERRGHADLRRRRGRVGVFLLAGGEREQAESKERRSENDILPVSIAGHGRSPWRPIAPFIALQLSAAARWSIVRSPDYGRGRGAGRSIDPSCRRERPRRPAASA